jgi:hypothetical protein
VRNHAYRVPVREIGPVAYASAVPVSRKRKKKPSKSGRSRVAQRGPAPDLSERDRDQLADVLRGLTANRELTTARRTSLAAAMATELVADLVAAVANQPDMIVADALCLRLGTVLSEADQAPPADHVSPPDLAKALVTAAVAEVEAGQADAWPVLTAVAGILPYPDGDTAGKAIARLRDTASEQGPAVTGQVRWTRDRYGSRFAVVAPISTADVPMRWYLWDIDACGHQALTVHSGFYATPEAALAEWQAGVGRIAAADTALAAVDDPWLLAELLPMEEGLLRSGGETAAQFAEYHRSRRLSEAVKQAMPRQGARPDGGLNVATATVEFTAWMRARDADQPTDIDELVTELADSWCLNNIDAVFTTCSPHRVALCVLHLRNFYLDDFADQLVALLPDWTRWLAERNATPPELADRCLPYAQGEPHPELKTEGAGPDPDYLARVIE